MMMACLNTVGAVTRNVPVTVALRLLRVALAASSAPNIVSAKCKNLVKLARKYAPGIALIANGGLHNVEHADQALTDGADLIALG